MLGRRLVARKGNHELRAVGLDVADLRRNGVPAHLGQRAERAKVALVEPARHVLLCVQNGWHAIVQPLQIGCRIHCDDCVAVDLGRLAAGAADERLLVLSVQHTLHKIGDALGALPPLRSRVCSATREAKPGLIAGRLWGKASGSTTRPVARARARVFPAVVQPGKHHCRATGRVCRCAIAVAGSGAATVISCWRRRLLRRGGLVHKVGRAAAGETVILPLEKPVGENNAALPLLQRLAKHGPVVQGVGTRIEGGCLEVAQCATVPRRDQACRQRASVSERRGEGAPMQQQQRHQHSHPTS
eukprot:m.109009 g.109009  ORF g.109009 m.109009 type:complete len:301 (-) comp9284_c0_seq3:302-1204(-)